MRGPLAGVPVVLKESFGAWKDSRAAANSTVVERLLDAGAVILGATNVP